MQRFIMFRHLSLLVAAAVAIGSGLPSHSSTHAVADFNQAENGPLLGQSVGQGFSGEWYGSGRISVVSNSLKSARYGLSQDGSGKAMQGDFNAPRQVVRELCCEMSGPIWFSFLVQLPSESARAGISWNASNTTGIADHAIFFLGEDLNIHMGANDVKSSVVSLGQTILVVGMVDVGRGEDTLKVWIDPDLAEEPDIERHDPFYSSSDTEIALKLERIGLISYDVSGDGKGGIIDHVRFATDKTAFGPALSHSGHPKDFAAKTEVGQREITIPTIDISDQTDRHIVIAQGTESTYMGHATTLLMPDGETMFAAHTYGHGGGMAPLRRSDDGGLSWSVVEGLPENWSSVRNCPSLYRLTDPQGTTRLFVSAGQGPGGYMYQAYSEDGGQTWTPMQSTGLTSVMPFCTIEPVDGGDRLLGMTNIRRPGETQEARSNVVVQSYSDDGGLTWSEFEIVLDLPGAVPCEPMLVRSPDGEQLAVIIRENKRSMNSWVMTTEDGGRNWSTPRQLPASLTGDRHSARYLEDGRLFIAFRDVAAKSPTRNHFVGWVGTYEDLVNCREGEYRVKLLHSHAGWDCGYAAVEVLPDETVIATTYIKYRPGPKKHSVVSTRFKIEELDAMVD